MKLDNPYYDEWFQLAGHDILKRFKRRNELVSKYAWAIPNDEAILELAKLSPILEVGAGAGYWAWLLTQAGADVLATDLNPPKTDSDVNFWHKTTKPWVDVEETGTEAAGMYPDRALMLCWPPYDEPMAHDALKAYTGKSVIYIGEGTGGCTGDDAFHNLLETDFKFRKGIEIPQWYGMHDRVMIYDRG